MLLHKEHFMVPSTFTTHHANLTNKYYNNSSKHWGKSLTNKYIKNPIIQWEKLTAHCTTHHLYDVVSQHLFSLLRHVAFTHVAHNLFTSQITQYFINTALVAACTAWDLPVTRMRKFSSHFPVKPGPTGSDYLRPTNGLFIWRKGAGKCG